MLCSKKIGVYGREVTNLSLLGIPGVETPDIWLDYVLCLLVSVIHDRHR